jgi:uncharacterized membrane protein
MYMVSFMTLAIFWVGQQTQLNYLARSNRSLVWIHIVFLFAVTTMPFSTRLLAEFSAYRVALLSYWVNLLLLGTTLYFSWVCAEQTGVVKQEMPKGVPAAIKRRIVIGQGLYALGALLSIVSTYLSVAFIILVQLNYAIGPRFTRRPRS